MSCNGCRLHILDIFLALHTTPSSRATPFRWLHQQTSRSFTAGNRLSARTQRTRTVGRDSQTAIKPNGRAKLRASESSVVASWTSPNTTRPRNGPSNRTAAVEDDSGDSTVRPPGKPKKPRDIEKRVERRQRRAPLKTDFQQDLRRKRAAGGRAAAGKSSSEQRRTDEKPSRAPTRKSRAGIERPATALTQTTRSDEAKRRGNTAPPSRTTTRSAERKFSSRNPSFPSSPAAEHERERKREPWQTQKAALKDKFGEEGYKPRKKLSPDTIEGIRALHANDPSQFSTPVLAKQFEVSPEAIRRILKSSWKPNPEEMEDRRERWENRGKKIWSELAEEKDYKPPKKWREMGVGTEPLLNRSERVQTHRRKERDILDFPSEGDSRGIDASEKAGSGRFSGGGRTSRAGFRAEDSNGRLSRGGRRKVAGSNAGGRSGGSLSISDQIAGALDMSKGLNAQKVRQIFSDRVL